MWATPGATRTTLAARARSLADAGPGRRLLGIAGPPGAGKSTLSAAMLEAVGPAAAVLPMDGFHRSHAWLAEAALADRKGAPETFDGEAFIAAVAAVRTRPAEVHRLPAFDHAVQEPEPGAISIGPEIRLVIVEGNYLLLDTAPWAALREHLDEAWFVDAPMEELAARLLVRQRATWGDEATARAFVEQSDLANARLVAPTRGRADVIVDAAAGADPDAVVLRRARASDAEPLRRLVDEAYGRYVERIGRLPLPMSADPLERVTRHETWLLDAGAGAPPAGVLELIARPDHLWVENVAVADAWRGRGAGRRLLAFAEGEAVVRGCPEIRLETNEHFTENLAIYARRGYRETGRVPYLGTDRVQLTKRLG
jgi:pantothenate kinase/N-acetylglutamate synthase-like GNAT family acetyltransferase